MAADVIVTVRLIRSFEHRNIRPVVIKNIDLDMTVQNFQQLVLEYVKTCANLPPPVQNYEYDTMKILHKAHGAKSNDPVINIEDDDKLTLTVDWTLKDCGVEHETEMSFFKLQDYKNYKAVRVNV